MKNKKKKENSSNGLSQLKSILSNISNSLNVPLKDFSSVSISLSEKSHSIKTISVSFKPSSNIVIDNTISLPKKISKAILSVSPNNIANGSTNENFISQDDVAFLVILVGLLANNLPTNPSLNNNQVSLRSHSVRKVYSDGNGCKR